MLFTIVSYVQDEVQSFQTPEASRRSQVQEKQFLEEVIYDDELEISAEYTKKSK